MLYVLLVILAVLASPSNGVAQDRRGEAVPDKSTFAGYDMIALYGGGNGSLLSIRSGVLFWLPTEYRVNDPAGFGYDVAVAYVRQMPNLFVTTPSSAAERDDSARAYRRFTTFELRASYSRLQGVGSIYDAVGSSVGTPALDYTLDLLAIEPRLTFDFSSMSSPSSGRFTVGGIFGHIVGARFAAGSGLSMPDASTPPEEFRTFYGAMSFGFGGRIGFGVNGYDAPALVPCVDLVIPLTSVAKGSTWLPFSLRMGLGVQWPL